MQNNPKEFGLIKMGKAAQKKPTTAVAAAGNVKNKLSCFDESDDSSDDGAAGPPGVDTRYQSSNAMKLAKAKINLAMEEDPNVFQYDEIYDDMKKDEQPKIVVQEERKPKYMTNLLKFAEKRKVEQEMRSERKVQKEREAEGEQFQDKEAFVTSAYKAVLEERKKAQEELEREEMREAVFDVTKQGNLNSFYRGLYKTDNFADVPKADQTIVEKDVKFNKKTIDRNKVNIRSRNLDEENPVEEHQQSSKPVSIIPNLDEDADIGDDDDKEQATTISAEKESTEEKKQPSPQKEANNNTEQQNVDAEEVETLPEKPKISREEYVRNLFTKRTVGEVFTEARHRYLLRKGLA